MIWLPVISVLLFVIVLHLNINRDVSRNKKEKATNHNNRFWIRMWCLIPSAIGFTIYKTGRFIVEWDALLIVSIVSMMIGLAWWNLFSGIRNLRLDHRWHFLGSEGQEDGRLEKILRRWPWLQWVKVATAVILIFTYIKI